MAKTDESKTSVSAARSSRKPKAVETIEISSDSEGDSTDDSSASSDDIPTSPRAKAGNHASTHASQSTSTRSSSRLKPGQEAEADTHIPSPRGTSPSHVVGDDQDGDHEGDDNDASDAEPTLGDLLRGAHGSSGAAGEPAGTTMIDVTAMMAAEATIKSASSQGAVARAAPGTEGIPTPASSTALSRPGAGDGSLTISSLGTVLTQALRTSDSELLESCLATTDAVAVRATIERLDPLLAGSLLSKLAARLHRRPGRAGSLLAWVQWTLILHGGALLQQGGVGSRTLVAQLEDLDRVLSERSRGLPSLLALKGKLDLLQAQMVLRQQATARGRRRWGDDDEDMESESDDGEDGGVVYVEGEEEAAGDVEMANGASLRRNGAPRDKAEDGETSEEDDDFPVTNGITAGDTDSESESEDADEDYPEDESDDGRAEESVDEDEIDHEDVDDSLGEDEDSDLDDGRVEAPPPKVRKTTGKPFSKRR